MGAIRKPMLIAAASVVVWTTTLGAQDAARVDALGDPLPKQAVARLGTDRFITRDSVTSLSFCADNSLLAGADVFDAYVWEARTGKRLLHVPEGGGRAVLSPDGAWLACGNIDWFIPRPIRIWNVNTGQPISVALPKDTAVCGFSPDSKTLALAFQKNMDVHLYDVGTWKLRQKLAGPGPADRCHDLVFRKDGHMMAVAHSAVRNGAQKGVVSVWDVDKKERRQEFLASQPDVKHLAFVKGEFLFALAGGTAQGWNVDNRKRAPWDNEFWLGPVAFDAEGKTLAHGHKSVVLDFASKRLIHAFGNEQTVVLAVSLSGDGKRFAAATRDSRDAAELVRVWDLETRKPVERLGHAGGVHAVAFSPDGKRIATASSDDETFRLWDAKTGRLVSTTSLRTGAVKPEARIWVGRGLTFIDQGKALCVAGQVWDIAGPKPERRLPRDTELTRELSAKATSTRSAPSGKWAVSFIPDPESKSTVSRDITIFWDAVSHKELLRMKAPNRAAGEVVDEFVSFWAFAHGAPLAAINRHYSNGPSTVIEKKQRLEIWDIAAGKRLHALARGGENLRHIAFSPDDRLLAVFAHYPPRLDMVHLGCQRKLWRQTWGQGNPNYTMRSIAFAPHGQCIAAMHSESCVQILETWTGEKIAEFEAHQRPIFDLAFSPTSRDLATASTDTTVLIWSTLPSADPIPPFWKDDERIWSELAGPSESAYRVIAALAGQPKRALRLLDKYLQPAPLLDPKQTQQDLKNVGSESFKERDAAMKRLSSLGPRLLPSLETAIKEAKSLEARRRLEALQESIDGRPLPEELRTLRAVLVLELLGSEESMSLLRRVAKGDPGAYSTRHAGDALGRIAKQQPRP